MGESALRGTSEVRARKAGKAAELIESPQGKLAFAVEEFCALYGVSRSHYYDLRRESLAPEHFHAGARVLISREASENWVRRRTAASMAQT